MGLLDSGAEEPRSKIFRHSIFIIVLVALVSTGIWYYFLRFHGEKKAVERFLDALIAGNTQRAYELWHAQPSYSYNDFLQDWGPNGYYGPIKSYHIETIQAGRQTIAGPSTGVVVVADLSPYRPFPSDNDAEKNRYTKEVRIWVERSDHSLGFPP